MTVSIAAVKLAWLDALALGDDVFRERFGVDVAPGWIGFPEAMEFALAAARENDEDEWGSYFVLDDAVLVGFGGFKGPPAAGEHGGGPEVEIGYAVAPSQQGRGIATAATRLFVERARDAGVVRVVAHTLAAPNPSTGVLERCGFVRTATLEVDPEGGIDEPVWRWERPVG